MARRKQSIFEDLVDIAAMMPWWLGVGLAMASYLLLHVASVSPNIAPADGKGMGEFVGRQLWVSLAMILQYLVPASLLLGSAISAFKQQKRKRLHAAVARAPSRNALENMSWSEFEALVGETFRRKGFVVTERGGNGPDGGVDLELCLGKDKYLVQCKQWQTLKVGVATVRELYRVMAAEGAVGGFVVSSGDFTEDAKRFVEGRSIELVATGSLLNMFNRTATQSGGEAIARMKVDPVCPQCAGKMALRIAKKGASAGQRFWGCERYPSCRGTRPV
jgi:restriction system protein